LPYIKQAAVAFWDHIKKQEPEVLLAYLLFILVIILFFVLRR